MAPGSNTVLIWGAGQHGRVVAEIARAAGHEVLGYIDANASKLDTVADAAGARVVFTEAELLGWLSSGRGLPEGVDVIVPAVGDNQIRLRHTRLLAQLAAGPLVHPTAYISPSAVIQRGSVVGPMAVINTNARVGSGVIVNTSAVVGHDAVVGDGAHIGAGVVLTGCTEVGECAFVATAATLIPSIRVGSNVVVGAGAVVIRNVPAGSTVVGVPAHPVKANGDASCGEADLPLAAASVGA